MQIFIIFCLCHNVGERFSLPRMGLFPVLGTDSSDRGHVPALSWPQAESKCTVLVGATSNVIEWLTFCGSGPSSNPSQDPLRRRSSLSAMIDQGTSPGDNRTCQFYPSRHYSQIVNYREISETPITPHQIIWEESSSWQRYKLLRRNEVHQGFILKNRCTIPSQMLPGMRLPDRSVSPKVPMLINCRFV